MFWLQQDIFYSLKLLLKCWRVNRCCMKQTGRLIKSACGRDRTCCCKSVVLTSLELGILLSAFASLSYSKCASPYLPWTVSSPAPHPLLPSHTAPRILVNLSHTGWAQDGPRSEVTSGTATAGQLPGLTGCQPSAMWGFSVRGCRLCSPAVLFS